MNNSLHDKRASSGSFWRRWLGGPLPLQTETTLFIFVSVLDVFMTFLLLWSSANEHLRVRFWESNPVARYFLDGWGIKGLVYYKLGLVTLVVVATQVIARNKPNTARWLLILATVVAAVVVIYSVTLLLRHTGPLPGP